jgi:hypothetical protein
VALNVVVVIAPADVTGNVISAAVDIEPVVTLDVVVTATGVTCDIVVADIEPDVTLDVVAHSAPAGVASYVVGIQLVVVLAHDGPPLFGSVHFQLL